MADNTYVDRCVMCQLGIELDEERRIRQVENVGGGLCLLLEGLDLKELMVVIVLLILY